MDEKNKSRSTLWRESKKVQKRCCPYHQAVVEETSDSCNCEYHLAALSPPPCNCEFHCDISEETSHSDTSINDLSSISDTSDLNVSNEFNDPSKCVNLTKESSAADSVPDGEMKSLQLEDSLATSDTPDLNESNEFEDPSNCVNLLKESSPNDSVPGKEAEIKSLQLEDSSATGDTSDWNVSNKFDSSLKGVKLLKESNPDDSELGEEAEIQSLDFGDSSPSDSDTEELISTDFKVCFLNPEVPENHEHQGGPEDGHNPGPDQHEQNNPENHPGPEDPGDSDDPDDPGDPDDLNYAGNDDSDSDPDGDMAPGQRNFSFEDESLNAVLEIVEGCTAREVVAMVIALSVRSNLDYQTTVKIFCIINVLLRNSPLPVTKDQMWRTLSKTQAGIRKHAYCSQCFVSLGLLDQLPNPVECQCGWVKPRAKVKYFITLNVRSQLETLLNMPDMWEKLQYPQHRQKSAPEAIEDILDGEAYQRLRNMAGGPSSPLDFTYTFNMDGFKVSKSSKSEAMPIFMRINELPPNLRQKHVILAGLWLDKDSANFNMFMNVFVKQANKLATNGISWRPNGIDLQTSRFFPTCCCVDAKGRAGILNMALYSGQFGCTFCEHEGIKLEGSMKFPIPGTVVRRLRVRQQNEYIEEVVIGEAPVRTDAMIRHLMEEAGAPGGQRIHGVIGPSQLMLMSFFDLGRGFSTDDLHPIYKGVTEFHTELLLQGIPGVYQIGNNQKAIISRRLLTSLTPTHISRKPRGIESMYMWKGSEWRNWLLFYGVPCMEGIVPNFYLRVFGLLSKAVFILTRDIILVEDRNEAARCLVAYVRQFQDIYGPENMRFNVHILTHVVDCVRAWGPLWAHSTFPYESWNHRLGKTLSSPRGASDQLVMRYIMGALVDSIQDHPLISDEVKNLIFTRIFESKMKNIQIVDGAYFFGIFTRREATEAEVAMLAEEGYDHNILVEYCQVKIKGLECRSINYRGEFLSNNTFIYTTEDQFGLVESIVTIEGQLGNHLGGMFVRLYEVGNGILGVPHIVPILNENERRYVPITNIRNLCVKVRVREQWCIAPMPNQMEID